MCSRRKLLVVAVLVLFFGCDDSNPVTPEPQRLPIEELLVDSVRVTASPNQATSLTAKAGFQTKVPVRVTIEVLGDQPLTHRVEEAATEHEISILGLYPDRNNRVVLQLTDAEENQAVDTLRIATDPLPEYMPTINVVTARPGQMEPGWTLSSLTSVVGPDDERQRKLQPFIFDANGDIRWYADFSSLGRGGAIFRRLDNGSLILGVGPDVYTYDMMGNQISHWSFPNYRFHHEVKEMPNGNLLVAVTNTQISTVQDHIIEVDRTSGAIVNTWDMREVMDVDRETFAEGGADWFHMNAIWYDEADDALIVSGREQGVVKVTRDNELVWILAPHKGWGKAGENGNGHDTADFLLTAVDAKGEPYPERVQNGEEDASGFSWAWGQHAPLILPNGNFFLFDNGENRNFSDEGASFSRGVEYAVDASAKTVQQVWQYGEERGEAFYSAFQSDVDYLPGTGNRLIMPASVSAPVHRALVTEVTHPGKTVVFEASTEFAGEASGAVGRQSVYRSERMPLYLE